MTGIEMTICESNILPVQRLRRLAWDALKGPSYHHWLPSDSSQAFICCIGAGPWKYGRRRKVQHEALKALGTRTIEQLEGTEHWFPLTWQNEMLNCLTRFLHEKQRSNETMDNLISVLRNLDDDHARRLFYDVCGRPNGTKVLSLFLRDYVGTPCFPIDRHVRRALEGLGLPTKEDEILDLCWQANIKPIPIARHLIGLKIKNPNWSHWPAEAAPESA